MPGQPTGPHADVFGQAADSLRTMAGAMARYPAFGSPSKAPARRDAADHTYDDTWGRATFELLHEPSPRLTIVLDHIRALAAVTDADGVVLSIATLVRPALESLGALWYLYDPDVDTRERVRRRYNLRLASLVEQWAIAASLSDYAAKEVKGKIDEIEASAGRLNFRFLTAKSRYDGQLGAHYLESRLPSDAKMISAVVEAGGSDGLGRMVHRMTSAVIHGQTHALLPYIHGRRASETEGVLAVEVGVDLRWFAILTGSVVQGSNQVMQRLIRHFGWSPGPWDRASQPALLAWRDWLNAA